MVYKLYSLLKGYWALWVEDSAQEPPDRRFQRGFRRVSHILQPDSASSSLESGSLFGSQDSTRPSIKGTLEGTLI